MPVVADKSTHFVIRLINRGCTNRPFYHIGVQKNRRPNLSKVEDQLGVYDPMVNIKGERIMTLDFDRLRKWLKRGAKLSRSMEQFLGLSGYFPIHPTTRLAAFRLHRAARQKAEKEKLEETNSEREKEHLGPDC